MSREIAKRDQGLFEDGKPIWCKQRTEPLEVMCLGLGRTGTTCKYLYNRSRKHAALYYHSLPFPSSDSLLKLTRPQSAMLEALSILGYGTAYNTRETARRHQMAFIGRMAEAKHSYNAQRWPPNIEQFESLWGEYRAISGDSVYPFAEEIIPLYPDAKIILTVREDEERWLKSFEETMWYHRNRWMTRILPYFDPVFAEISKLTAPFWKYLLDDDLPGQGIRWYREHNAMVQRLAGDRCLVFSVKEGWEPLCNFLGKEVPSVPFPNVNKVEEHRNIFSTARQDAVRKILKRLMARGALAAVVIGLIWWQRSRIGSVLRGLRR